MRLVLIYPGPKQCQINSLTFTVGQKQIDSFSAGMAELAEASFRAASAEVATQSCAALDSMHESSQTNDAV